MVPNTQSLWKSLIPPISKCKRCPRACAASPKPFSSWPSCGLVLPLGHWLQSSADSAECHPSWALTASVGSLVTKRRNELVLLSMWLCCFIFKKSGGINKSNCQQWWAGQCLNTVVKVTFAKTGERWIMLLVTKASEGCQQVIYDSVNNEFQRKKWPSLAGILGW